MGRVIYVPTKRTYLILGILFVMVSSIITWYVVSSNSEQSWKEKMYNPGIKEKLVIIDPGHGGADPGALVYGLKESDFNLALSRQIKKELEKLGATAILTREEKGELVPEEQMNYFQWINNLEGRKEFALKKRGHIFISIHGNTSKSEEASGGIVFYTELNPKSKILAQKVQKELNEFWSVEREIQEKGLSVICWDTMPSILIEVGFLTNDSNRKILFESAERSKIARAISQGIKEYCGELAFEENEREK